MPAAIQIQAIGNYFQNDNNGFVINPASKDKIPEHWYPVIELIKQSYIDQLGKKLHSIYLRGSLVRGLGIDGFSDLDSFAIVYGFDKYWAAAPWEKELNALLCSKFDFVREVELMLSPFHLSFLEANPKLSMIIKTQSLCISGKDMGLSMPKFKPDKSMMLNYRWIESDHGIFLSEKEMPKADLKNFLKVVIRTGYELVMENEGKYTPDLYWCCKSFSEYFPERAPAMKTALFFYLNPSKIIIENRLLILDLSKWLIEKVNSQLL